MWPQDRSDVGTIFYSRAIRRIHLSSNTLPRPSYSTILYILFHEIVWPKIINRRLNDWLLPLDDVVVSADDLEET